MWRFNPLFRKLRFPPSSIFQATKWPVRFCWLVCLASDFPFSPSLCLLSLHLTAFPPGSSYRSKKPPLNDSLNNEGNLLHRKSTGQEPQQHFFFQPLLGKSLSFFRPHERARESFLPTLEINCFFFFFFFQLLLRPREKNKWTAIRIDRGSSNLFHNLSKFNRSIYSILLFQSSFESN